MVAMEMPIARQRRHGAAQVSKHHPTRFLPTPAPAQTGCGKNKKITAITMMEKPPSFSIPA